MRWVLCGVCVLGLSAQMVAAQAEGEPSTRERILGGVISGLLGEPQQSRDAAYVTKQRERLVSLLHSGEYATSRQGEPVDVMILGVPLTHRDHVYTAKPIPPTQTAYR